MKNRLDGRLETGTDVERSLASLDLHVMYDASGLDGEHNVVPDVSGERYLGRVVVHVDDVLDEQRHQGQQRHDEDEGEVVAATLLRLQAREVITAVGDGNECDVSAGSKAILLGHHLKYRFCFVFVF